MLRAVDLHDHPVRQAGEADDGRAERHLPAEFHALKLPSRTVDHGFLSTSAGISCIARARPIAFSGNLRHMPHPSSSRLPRNGGLVPVGDPVRHVPSRWPPGGKTAEVRLARQGDENEAYHQDRLQGHRQAAALRAGINVGKASRLPSPAQRERDRRAERVAGREGVRRLRQPSSLTAESASRNHSRQAAQMPPRQPDKTSRDPASDNCFSRKREKGFLRSAA